MIVETKYLATLYGIPTVSLIRLFSTEEGSCHASPVELSSDQAASKLFADPRVGPLKLKWKNILQYLAIVESITTSSSSLPTSSSSVEIPEELCVVDVAEQDMKEFCKIVEEIKVASGIVVDQSLPIFASNQNENNNQKLNTSTLSSTLYLQFIQKYCMK